MKNAIFTELAPLPIGVYSQAIRSGNTIYLAGQIPLSIQTQALVQGGIKEQTLQVFSNIKAIAQAAKGDLDNIVKLTIYLINLEDFPVINDVMQELFHQPYPARTTIQVSKLPKGSLVEIDAILVLPDNH